MHPNHKRILELNLDDHSEATLKRLCLEVPCVVNLSHCNVIAWFEDQVRQKLKKSSKWRYYQDQQRFNAFVQRRGGFLYDKYLSPLVPSLKQYNRQLLRHIVWVVFARQDHRQEEEKQSEDDFSIDTIYGSDYTHDDLSSCLSLPTSMSQQFEYDLDNIISSTQRSEEE